MMQVFLKTFATIFLAELGDKTQLATMASASTVGSHHQLVVFAASAAALVLSSALAVLVGARLNRIVSPKTIQIAAGCVFILFGVLYLRAAFSQPAAGAGAGSAESAADSASAASAQSGAARPEPPGGND
jgi:Predicted membrane protein